MFFISFIKMTFCWFSILINGFPESDWCWCNSIGIGWNISAKSFLEAWWSAGKSRLHFWFCCFLNECSCFVMNNLSSITMDVTCRWLVALLVFLRRLLSSLMLMGKSMLPVQSGLGQLIQLTRPLISLWRFEKLYDLCLYDPLEKLKKIVYKHLLKSIHLLNIISLAPRLVMVDCDRSHRIEWLCPGVISKVQEGKENLYDCLCSTWGFHI